MKRLIAVFLLTIMLASSCARTDVITSGEVKDAQPEPETEVFLETEQEIQIEAPAQPQQTPQSQAPSEPVEGEVTEPVEDVESLPSEGESEEGFDPSSQQEQSVPDSENSSSVETPSVQTPSGDDESVSSQQSTSTDAEQAKPEQTEPEQTEPEQTEPEQAEPEIMEQPETGSENELIMAPAGYEFVTKDKAKNSDVKPSFDINNAGLITDGTPVLSGKTIKMYASDKDAFFAGKLDDKEWMQALTDNYGLNVKYTVRKHNSLAAAQLIAQKSGIELDIISTDMNDFVSSLTLMKSATDMIVDTTNAPFSKTVFENTNGKLFTSRADVRMMWYNTDIIGDDTPYKLFEKGEWTTDALSVFSIRCEEKNAALIANDNWLVFGSAGGTRASGMAKNNIGISLTKEHTINAFAKFASLSQTKVENPSFAKQTAAFIYTNDPGVQSFKVSFVPIPAHSQTGKCVADFSGHGIGVSKTVSPVTERAAVVFACLWSARYTEYRIDYLMTDLGLGYDKTRMYLDYCDNHAIIADVDKKVADMFVGVSVPKTLYADAKTVRESYNDAYARIKILDARVK